MNQQKARWPVWALACACMALPAARATADGEPTTAEAAVTVAATPVVDPEAKALLMDMAAFLAKTPAFTVTVRGSYDAVVYFRKDLRVRLPLAALLVSTLPAEFERRVTGVEYVEETAILGAPAHHLYVQTDSVDFQVWIADGA